MGSQEMFSIIDEIEKLPFFVPEIKQRYEQQLNSLKESIENEELHITVVGDFSTGKTTFLNALMGQDLLPHASTETTAAITYIHNVAIDDDRCGWGEVFFRENQPSLRVDYTQNPELLKEYLTTESKKMKVAEQVEAVHVYCHMFDSEHKFVIIDTPGLNGMADYHSGITLHEVQQSHASVFLVGVRGLSRTAVDSLRILRQYQKHIIFVMNRIDALHTDEGETPESALTHFKENLYRYFPDGDDVEEKCFAISALFALAARDKNISHLYQDDDEDLTDAMRKDLLQQSQITFLEEYLYDVAKKNFVAVLQQAIKDKCTLLLCDMNNNAEYYLGQYMLETKDNKETLKAGLEQQKKEFQHWQEDLRRYIHAECGGLKKAVDAQLEKHGKAYYEEGQDGLQQIEIEDETIVEQFVKKVNKDAGEFHLFWQQRLAEMFASIYCNAICRADSFIPKIKITAGEKISFEKIITQRMDYHQPEDRAKKYEREIDDYKNKILEEKQRIKQAEEKLQNKKSELETQRRAKEELTNEHIRNKQNLGNDPGTQRVKTQRKVEVEDTLLWIIPWGTKIVTETYYADDYTAHIKWENEQKEIDRKYTDRSWTLDEKIEDLKSAIQEAEDATGNSRVNKLEEKLKAAKNYKIEAEKRYEQELNQARDEFIRFRRKQMRESLEKFWDNCVKMVEKGIDENFEKNEQCIQDKVAEHYKVLWKEEQERLKRTLAKQLPMNVPRVEVELFQEEIRKIRKLQ